MFPFLEDEHGNELNGIKISTIRSVARGLWRELDEHGQAPEKWGKATNAVSALFYREMRAKFPEFKLCDDNWKLREFTTKVYCGWHANLVKERNQQPKTFAKRLRRTVSSSSSREDHMKKARYEDVADDQLSPPSDTDIPDVPFTSNKGKERAAGIRGLRAPKRKFNNPLANLFDNPSSSPPPTSISGFKAPTMTASTISDSRAEKSDAPVAESSIKASDVSLLSSPNTSHPVQRQLVLRRSKRLSRSASSVYATGSPIRQSAVMSTVDISALASPTNPHAIHTTSVTVSLADAASALVALANPGASTTTLAEPGMAPKTPVPTTSAGAVHVAAPGEPAAGIPASAATQSAPISSAVSPTTAPKVSKVVPAAVNTRSKKQRAKATNVDAKSSWTPGIAITPRNLCARDWLKEHPNGKKTEFEDHFKGLSAAKKKVYGDLAKRMKADAMARVDELAA